MDLCTRDKQKYIKTCQVIISELKNNSNLFKCTQTNSTTGPRSGQLQTHTTHKNIHGNTHVTKNKQHTMKHNQTQATQIIYTQRKATSAQTKNKSHRTNQPYTNTDKTQHTQNQKTQYNNNPHTNDEQQKQATLVKHKHMHATKQTTHFKSYQHIQTQSNH